MKVTTPSDMRGSTLAVESAIALFEKEFSYQRKGLTEYVLTIKGYIDNSTRKEIQKIYRDAGWEFASCFSDSVNPNTNALVLQSKIQ